MGHFGSFLGHFGNFGSILGQFGQFCVIFGIYWVILGHFWAIFLVQFFVEKYASVLFKLLFATLQHIYIHKNKYTNRHTKGRVAPSLSVFLATWPTLLFFLHLKCTRPFKTDFFLHFSKSWYYGIMWCLDLLEAS